MESEDAPQIHYDRGERILAISEFLSLVSACTILLPMQVLNLAYARSFVAFLMNNFTDPAMIVCNVVAGTQILLWWSVRCRLIYARLFAICSFVGAAGAVLYLLENRFIDRLLVYGGMGWFATSACNLICVLCGMRGMAGRPSGS